MNQLFKQFPNISGGNRLRHAGMFADMKKVRIRGNSFKNISLFLLAVITVLLMLLRTWQLDDDLVSLDQELNTARLRRKRGPGEEFYQEDELPIPCVLLHPNGGTGNQLFMYAAAYAAAKSLNATFFLQETTDTPRKNRKFNPKERKYVLDYFNLNNSFINYLPSEKDIPTESKFGYNELNWFKKDFPRDKILMPEDYWESEVFFEPYKEEIIPQFELLNIPNVNLLDGLIYDITNSESVSVHIRRGDFVRRGFNDRDLPIEYQFKAMEYIQKLNLNKSLKYFIFSDGIEYVKSQFKSNSKWASTNMDNNIIFVSNSNRTSLEEFYLMSLCKHNIIANSTFSWWAAYLNKYAKKIIIAPYPRNEEKYYDMFNHVPEVKKYKKLLDKLYVYPKGWIKLNPFVNV